LHPTEDRDLVSIGAAHLFPAHKTWIGFARDGLLRRACCGECELEAFAALAEACVIIEGRRREHNDAWPHSPHRGLNVSEALMRAAVNGLRDPTDVPIVCYHRDGMTPEDLHLE
jgi:hypothetical protein